MGQCDAPAPDVPDATRGGITAHLFGVAEFVLPDGHRVTPASSRLFCLLAVLSLSPRHRIETARLLELVWPDLPDRRASRTLIQQSYALRRRGVRVHSSTGVTALDASQFVRTFSLTTELTDFRARVACGHEPFGPFLAGYLPKWPALRRWFEDKRDELFSGIVRDLSEYLAGIEDGGMSHEASGWIATLLEFDPSNPHLLLAEAERAARAGSTDEARARLRRLDRHELRQDLSLAQRLGDLERRLNRASSDANAASGAIFGRDAELSEFRATLGIAAAGRSVCLVLTGHSGIGKSRLLQEFSRHATLEGFRVLLCPCRLRSTAGPGSLTKWLAQMLSGFRGAAGMKPAYYRALQESVAAAAAPSPPSLAEEAPSAVEILLDALAAVSESHPLLLAFDDIEAADAESRQVLSLLLALLSNERVIVVVSARSEASVGFLSLEHERVQQIRLAPLSQTASLNLLSAIIGVTDPSADFASLVEGAAGSPLALRVAASYQAGRERPFSRPRDVGEVIQRRLVTLGTEARCVLQSIALFGGQAEADRIGELLGLSASVLIGALQELSDASLIEWRQESVSCSALVSGIAVGVERTEIVHLLATAIVKTALRGGTDSMNRSEAIAIAKMAARYSDGRTCVRVASAIGERLAATGAFPVANEIFVSALNKLPRHDRAAIALLEGLHSSARKACAWDVLQSLPSVVQRHVGLDRLTASMRIDSLDATLRFQKTHYPLEAIDELLGIASSHIESEADRARAATVCITHCSDLFFTDRALAAMEILREIRPPSCPRSILHLRGEMQFEATFGSLSNAEVLADEILRETAESVDTKIDYLRATIDACRVLRFAGRSIEAERVLKRAVETHRFMGTTTRQFAYWQLSVLALERGDLQRAIHLTEANSAEVADTDGELDSALWCLHRYRIQLHAAPHLVDPAAMISIASEHERHGGRSFVGPASLALIGMAIKRDVSDHHYAQYLERLLEHLDRNGTYPINDVTAIACSIALWVLGEGVRSADVLDRFLSAQRRECGTLDSLFALLPDDLRCKMPPSPLRA